LLLGVVAGLAAGCSCEEAETLGSLSEAERGALQVVDAAALKALLASHQGKIVVLAAWSVRQEGGVALHAALASLAERSGEDGLAVVALNLDTLADVRRKVLPVLRKQRPAFTSCVLDGEQMMILGLTDPDWGGLLPAVWLFDTKGKLAASFYGAEALGKATAGLERLRRPAPRARPARDG